MRQCIAIVLLLRYQIYSASISDKSALISNKVADLPVLQYEDVQQTPLPTLVTESTTAAITTTTTTTTSTPSTATTSTLINNEITSLPPQIRKNTSVNPTVSSNLTTTLAPNSNITLGLSETTPTTAFPPTTTSQVINNTESTTTVMTTTVSIASIKKEETTVAPTVATTQAEATSTAKESMPEKTSQVPTTAFASVTELPFLRDYIEKRAAPEVSYKNGLISGAFIPTLDSRRATASDDSVKALDRKLEHGGQQKEEYVGVWISGMRSVWGKLTPNDGANGLVGSFVIDGQVRNTTEPSIRSQSRMLIYKGTRTENNFGFAWVNARLLDQSTAVTLYSNICTQTAPAVYIDRRENYEFLGEADLVNKKFTYILGGHIRDLLDRNEFLNNVYVLTKQRCSCSCDSVIIG